MIEIIPNWHPIFVHFTVALFSTSVLLFCLAYLTLNFNTLSAELQISARWCLWLAGIAVIPTIIAGLYAYNSVNHDTVSHLAMTNHRNWALTTGSLILLVTVWSIFRFYRHKTISLLFIIALLLIQLMVLSTAWRGGELVYRYGLGVMSLPQHGKDGHDHSASGIEQHEEQTAHDHKE